MSKEEAEKKIVSDLRNAHSAALFTRSINVKGVVLRISVCVLHTLWLTKHTL